MYKMMTKGKGSNEKSSPKRSIFPKQMPKNLGGASLLFRTSHSAKTTGTSAPKDPKRKDSKDSDVMDLDSNDAHNMPATAVPPKEDHSWMQLQENEEDDSSEELTTEINSLQAKKRNGKITQEEGYELARLENTQKVNKTRHRLRHRPLVEDPESMFIPEDRLDNRDKWDRRSPARDSEQFDGEDTEEEAANEKRIRYQIAQNMRANMEEESVTKKQRRKPAKDAREVRER